MSILKKGFSVFIVIAMVLSLFSLTACHSQNEVAVTIGDVEIPTSLYLCFLIQADSEARTKIVQAHEDDAEFNPDTVDFSKEKIDDIDFDTWAKNRAKETVTEYGTYQKIFKENEIKLDESALQEIDTYTDYYWNSYGYSIIYGANGVNFETYKTFFTYSYMTRNYFLGIYGKDGTTPVPEADIKTAIDENFTNAYVISLSHKTTDAEGNSVTKSPEELVEIKNQAVAIETRLKNGEKFDDIYKELNPDATTEEEHSEDDGHDHSADTTSTTSEFTDNDDESFGDASAVDDSAYTGVFASEKAQPYTSSQNVSFDHFEDVKDMKVGETKVVDSDYNGYSLVIYKNQNILDNSKMVESFTEAALYILKQEEVRANIKTQSDALNVKFNNFAIDRFKPSKLVYPTTQG